MTLKRTPRPRDPIQLGKLMLDIATGAVSDGVDDGKDAGAAAMGRKGAASRAMAAGVSATLWELSDMVKVLEEWEVGVRA